MSERGSATRRTLAIVNNPVFGGGTNLVMQLAGPLRERGWETLSMVPDLPEAQPTLERLRAGGVPTGVIELHRLRRSADPRKHWELVRTFRREVRRLRGLIRRERIDLVQAFGDTNPHLALAGALEGRAVVWTLYDTVTPPSARRLTMPLVTRTADVILTWGRTLARAHPGAESLGERCITVYPPVDTTRFVSSPERRAAARAELGVPADALLVGTVGNRNPTKGHDHLAQAIAQVGRDDLWTRVLGVPSPAHAEYMSEVDAKVDALGLGERFGFLDPGTRVAELLPALDVFCMASVPRSEGMPTVLFEAMSCGLPVVTTDVGAVREFVEEGETGFVVPTLDDAALAQALGRLLADADLRERLGATARQRVVERYDLPRCAEVYAGAFELALAHRHARTRRP